MPRFYRYEPVDSALARPELATARRRLAPRRSVDAASELPYRGFSAARYSMDGALLRQHDTDTRPAADMPETSDKQAKEEARPRGAHGNERLYDAARIIDIDENGVASMRGKAIVEIESNADKTRRETTQGSAHVNESLYDVMRAIDIFGERP